MRAIFIIIASFFFLKSYGQGDFIDHEPVPPGKSLQFYEENGMMGLRKNARKLITPAIYDTLVQLNNSRYVGKRFSTTKQQEVWGILDNLGQIILPFNYFTCRIDHGTLIMGSGDNNRIRLGLYDFNGTEIISPRYDEIQLSEIYIIGKVAKKHTIFTLSGVKLIDYSADSLRFLDDNLLILFNNGKAGLESIDGSLSLANTYENIKLKDGAIYAKMFPKWSLIQGFDTTTFYRSEIYAWDKQFIARVGDKKQVLNKKKENVSVVYDEIEPFSASLSIVNQGGKWGVIDAKGKEVIPAQYQSVFADDEFLAARIISNIPKWLIFDLYGYQKSELTYDSLMQMTDGRIPVKRNGKWGYLDRYGVEIIAPIYEEVDNFKNGRAHVRFFGESGIIDRSGNWVVLPFNQRIIDFNNHVILTKIRDQYQILNFNNELVYFSGNTLSLGASGINEVDSIGQYLRTVTWDGTIFRDMYWGERIRAGGSGLTIFRENGRFGFKDQQDRIIIANRYEQVKPFHQKLAAIKIRDKWGFIDLDEVIRVQPMYDSVGHYVEGTCLVKRNGLLGVIDKRGNEIITPEFEDIIRLANNSYKIKQAGKWGLIGENGEFIIRANYDLLQDTRQGYFIVSSNGKYGSINNEGVSEIPLLYDLIDYNLASKTLIIKESVKKEWALIMKTHP